MALHFSIFQTSTNSISNKTPHKQLKALIEEGEVNTDEWFKQFQYLGFDRIALKKLKRLHEKASNRIIEVIESNVSNEVKDCIQSKHLANALLFHCACVFFINNEELNSSLEKAHNEIGGLKLAIGHIWIRVNCIDDTKLELSETQIDYLNKLKEKIYEDDLGCCAPLCGLI